MALSRPHEVMKMGRLAAAAKQASLKPAPTTGHDDEDYFDNEEEESSSWTWD